DLLTKVECQTVECIPNEDQASDALHDPSQKKKRMGFRDRKFIAYEDRIRAYSTPDKIFRYFATLKCVDDDGETILMTPDDFVRSITPGTKQPEGLDLDSFLRYDPKVTPLNLDIPKDSVFYTLCDKALISFSDFVFLLTVLSTPRRQFEIAFRMFDLNGDGELDSEEFDVVRSVIMDTTAMGRRHRDHSTTGSTLKKRSNSALQQYFFGPEGDQKLTIKKFLDFHAQLQEEITRLEFDRASPVDGKITEVQFANFLLTYAGFSEQRRRKMIRSVKQKFSKSEDTEGISYRDFADFNLLLRSIADVDTALTFHHMAGVPIDQATLHHVALTVANIELSPHVVDVVFTLFDENNDGQLSYREFVGVMRRRLLRGLDKPMDTGFVRFVSALFKCTKEQIYYHSECLMSPRTRQGRVRQLQSVADEPGSAAPLVLEDYEVFEVETAELTIEEVDDFASSLLLSNDPPGPAPSSPSSEIGSAIARNSHTLIHSPHSLATTSVVLAAQHAQAMEYKSLAVTNASQPTDEYCKTSIPVIQCSGHQQQTLLADKIDPRPSDWMLDLPVHLLTVRSSLPQPCPPVAWPQCLLAFTDAPAFVRAVTSDLRLYASHKLGAGFSEDLQVASCDSTCDWTSCQVVCCEAEVEILESGPQFRSSDTPLSVGSLSDEVRHSDCAPVHTEKAVPLLVSSQRLFMPDPVGLRLLPFSGVRAELSNCATIATAIYVILAENQASLVPPDCEASPPSHDSSVEFIDEDRSSPSPTDPGLLVMLVALVPTAASRPEEIDPMRINHRLDRSHLSRVINSNRQTNFVTLVALVDIVQVDDSDTGTPTLKVIIHQRLHHFPELAFHVQSTD
ncbi:EF hand, partial [Opisthorchis viverrini]